MLKVDADRSEATLRHARQDLANALLDELTGWSPQERMGALRAWHRGSLSLVHLNVLAVLAAQGPLTMGHLAEALDVSVASATGIVDRIERRGFVERLHATDDRRLVRVQLTIDGNAVFGRLEEQRRSHLARLLDELTDRELAGLLAGVRAVHAAHARLSTRGDRVRRPALEPDQC